MGCLDKIGLACAALGKNTDKTETSERSPYFAGICFVTRQVTTVAQADNTTSELCALPPTNDWSGSKGIGKGYNSPIIDLFDPKLSCSEIHTFVEADTQCKMAAAGRFVTPICSSNCSASRF